jgi:putative sigma-54 modulation protein
MNITYTGQLAFSPAQQKKLDARFAKLSKLLDRGGEKGAHIILTNERHLIRAEITVHYYDHPLVGLDANPDASLAILAAVDKLEKQFLKQREKWRDTKRRPASKAKMTQGTTAPVNGTKPVAAKPAPGKGAKAAKSDKKAAKSDNDSPKQVYRVNHHSAQKPMTLDEAVIEMEDRDYTVYRDADTDKVHVLVKRRDGHLDLIEG